MGLGYQYRGPWAFGFNYAFLESDSNSYGQTFRSHRFSVYAGVQLFWQLSLLGKAVMQVIQYPDGIYLPSSELSPDQPGILTIDGDELGPRVSLQLSRPLGDLFEIDFRWQMFFGYLQLGATGSQGGTQLSYFRQTFTLGVSFRLDSRNFTSP